MRWTLPLACALVAPLVAGCFGGPEDARAALVPYPRLGDVAVYEATGALVDLARWENGIPFLAASAQVRLSLSPAQDAIDGARAIHPTFRVLTEVAEAGVFVKRSERFVSPRHQAVVQAFYPLSQDQSVLAFDERGFPWLFGASALFGEELREGVPVSFALPDNLGRGVDVRPRWDPTWVDGAWRLTLSGAPGVNGTLRVEPGSAWPVEIALSIDSPALAPHVRSDGGYPVSMVARRVSLVDAGETSPPRDRGASFGEDASVVRAVWDGEKPPDGDATALAYPLSEAVRDAKLLDKPLADWLAAHDAPIVYRGTFQMEAGPVEGSRQAHWLVQWVDRSNAYYEVQIARVFPPASALPIPMMGVPRVESSGPAEAPADPNHGWFAPDAVPEVVVPLSEGIRIVRDVFGAQEVQIFLRSFTDPPGHSYFIDGGFESVGRYTVVYNPNTGFIEQATGPVQPRGA